MALLSRRFILSLIGVFLLTATVAIQLSWYYVGHPTKIDRYAELRVLSSNLRYGRVEPQSFVELAKQSADIVTASELTKEAVDGFAQAGIAEVFPYAMLDPRPGASGIGMWSRHPLKPLSAPRHRFAGMPAARVEIPGLEFKPVVASVHIVSPVSGDENTIAEWRNGMAGAKAQLDNFAREAGPASVVVGGDYNSTPDMRQYRDLLTNGYNDAVQQTGSGFAPTFKSDSWLPPVITIDHILTRNAAASSIKTVMVNGSDHRALLATIRLPLDPAA